MKSRSKRITPCEPHSQARSDVQHEMFEIRPGRVIHVVKTNSLVENLSKSFDVSKFSQDSPGSPTPSRASHKLGNRRATNVQPIKQLIKETYLPTDTDVDTETAGTKTDDTETADSNFDLDDGDCPKESVICGGSEREQTLVFFIHGVGGSSDVWNAQLRFLAGLGFLCAALDLIGHGLSSKPKKADDYHFEEIANDVNVIFKKIMRKQNVLVAHSYGCAFATILAHDCAPPLVSRLILMGAGAPGPLVPEDLLGRIPTPILSCCHPCIQAAFKKGAFHDAKQWKNGPSIEGKRRRLSNAITQSAFKISASVLHHTMRGQWWPGGTLAFHARITTPSLVIHGESDQLVFLEEDEQMFKALPNAQFLIVKSAAHMTMMEKPEDINSFIFEFIENH